MGSRAIAVYVGDRVRSRYKSWCLYVICGALAIAWVKWARHYGKEQVAEMEEERAQIVERNQPAYEAPFVPQSGPASEPRTNIVLSPGVNTPPQIDVPSPREVLVRSPALPAADPGEPTATTFSTNYAAAIDQAKQRHAGRNLTNAISPGFGQPIRMPRP
jgi:hypothetical protein